MWWRVVWIVAAACAGCAAGSLPAEDPPSGLPVYKCCPEGEELDTASADAGGEHRCHPAPSYDPNDFLHNWRPHVYDPERKHFKNDIPSHWNLHVGIVDCPADGVLIRVLVERDNAPSYVLYINGSIFVTEYTMILAGPGAYCLDAREVLVCVTYPEEESTPAETATGPVVKKCCGRDATFVKRGGNTACELAPSQAAGSLPAAAVDPRAFALHKGLPHCTPGDLVQAGFLRAGDARLKPDGSLVLPGAGPAALRPLDFCVERMVTAGTEDDMNAPVADEAWEEAPVVVYACHASLVAGAAPKPPRAPPADDDPRFALYPVGLMLSVFFLAATLCAGCLLPGAHHALHWRCQTAHVACLLVGDLLLAITQMTGPGTVPPQLCRALAVAMHFFFMAAFLWLNTMCWNIWWTFRDLHPARLDKSQEIRRLRFCHLYAWGFSFLIAGLGLLFDKLPDSHTGFVRPRFGHQKCWFADDTEIFVYFYVPMGITLTINVILFALTARALTCGLWKQEVVKSSSERATLSRVCMKLVVVMGLTWVMDIISWAAGGPDYLWYFTDLINALQGVFIFAVVGCQQQVWAAVNRLWCWYIPRAGSSATGQHVSTYSQGLPSLGESVTHSHTHKSAHLETMC